MCNSKKCKDKMDKGVIYTNTAIGFEKLNPHILATQIDELKMIFGTKTPQKDKKMEDTVNEVKEKELSSYEQYLKLKEKYKDDPTFHNFYIGV